MHFISAPIQKDNYFYFFKYFHLLSYAVDICSLLISLGSILFGRKQTKQTL